MWCRVTALEEQRLQEQQRLVNLNQELQSSPYKR